MRLLVILVILAVFAAVSLAGLKSARAADSDSVNLVKAKECRTRGGLPNFLSKIQKGETVRVAYLGGSITDANGWRPLTLAWFRERFPEAKVEEIDAAIPGTGSDLGAFRVEQDVLDHSPDLLFVEFAVNDGSGARSRPAMEGIVRKTWKRSPSTDLCFVYTFSSGHLANLENGLFPPSASIMEGVADHYEIPTIHMGLVAVEMIKNGEMIMKGPLTTEGIPSFSGDGVHPYTETGHQLYRDAVARSVEEMLLQENAPKPHALGKPLDPNNWEDATRVPVSQVAHSEGWQNVPVTAENFGLDFMHYAPFANPMWRGPNPGDYLEIQFKGRGVGLFSVKGSDLGQAKTTIDGGEPIIGTTFDLFSYRYRIKPLWIDMDLTDAEHTVRIEVDSQAPDKATILG
ncbi:SGNH/GDSL hydrolase family protein, partial [bacterium]|nr:SGNH/GDSL hydrolase family protein [bacterium]